MVACLIALFLGARGGTIIGGAVFTGVLIMWTVWVVLLISASGTRLDPLCLRDGVCVRASAFSVFMSLFVSVCVSERRYTLYRYSHIQIQILVFFHLWVGWSRDHNGLALDPLFRYGVPFLYILYCDTGFVDIYWYVSQVQQPECV